MTDQNEFLFLPLGGSGEIGMNLNLFGFGPPHNRQWIIVDIGVTFGGPDTPGIDIIMPDIEFIEARKDRLLGIVLTHAHEDHMGALARLWPRLECPVYTTPFTMWLVKDRLSEFGLLDKVPLHEVSLKSRFSIGPFDLEMITLTHSIPEPNGLAIRTELGTVLHTGDWKIDHDPQIGDGVDAHALEAIAKEGVAAMICDSTNVFTPGMAGSEGGVREELSKLIGEYKGHGVAVASFASNVARLESVLMAARDHDRTVCLVGRSMKRMVNAARSVGLLSGTELIIDEDQAAQLPQDHVLYLCTGSQGEPRAALSRIANGDHRYISFKKGDVVIFSSKIIPGNEKGIFALQNALADEGVEIVTEKDRAIHVSGHPCRDELAQMYEWVKPRMAIPVHGERRHLIEHANLARALGIKKSLAPHNGEMIRLLPQGPDIIDIVPAGRLHQDGDAIVSAEDNGLRARKKMAYAGQVTISLVYNKSGKILSGPDLKINGFPEGENGDYLDDLYEVLANISESAFRSMPRKALSHEEDVEAKIRAQVKKHLRQKTSKRALVDVLVHRL